MQQAALFDGLSLDLLSSSEDGFRPAVVDISGCQVAEALMVSVVVVVIDEVADRLLERPGQVVVLKQDAVLQGLVPALDLALGLRMVRGPSDMIHALFLEPPGEIPRDVAAAIARREEALF